MEKKLFIYTRISDDKFCPPAFGNSIHFAVSEDGKVFIPLNRNRGILYAKAEISETDQIVEKELAQPEIYRLPDGDYAILARQTGKDGAPDGSREHERLVWLTKDFMSFQECGMTDISNHPQLKEIRLHTENGMTEYPFEGVIAGSSIGIGDEIYEMLLQKYMPVRHTYTYIPDEIPASCADDVREIMLTAHYSDGSTSQKKYDIPEEELSRIDFQCPGTYEVTADIRQKQYGFPLAVGFADPVVFPWKGKYYYISTNDNAGDIGFLVREADCVADLFAPDAEQHLILDKDEEKKLIQTFWAPEFHVIGGSLYILFAVSGDTFGPQCHMMRLKENGSVIDAADWEDPVRVRKADGTFLAEEGITLDMTHFENDGRSYLVWSYRLNCMAEGDTGSMLYIAETDPAQPDVLVSEPVRLSRPLYGWENVAGTINNEGPYPLITEKYIYIAYSGGGACDWTYTVGFLRADRRSDLLDPANWEKSTCPALSTSDLEGIYGPGHNSFFTDADGDTYIAFHGEVTPYHSPRSTAIHRVHFNREGEPLLNMCFERDVKEEYRSVRLTVTVG